MIDIFNVASLIEMEAPGLSLLFIVKRMTSFAKSFTIIKLFMVFIHTPMHLTYIR